MSASLPRILAIIGSGETSPTMTTVHQGLLERLGPLPAPAVLLDTSFGFQENASEVCAKTMQYFRDNVRHPIAVASFRRAGGADQLAYETMLAQLREATYVFAGPGSPSYALRQWRGSAVPDSLAEKLRSGGCLVFASAAACTLGPLALPVYEVYKAGEDPHWLEGLDVLAEIGINAVVIPHFSNSEGGTHDTRYCYMGERRLRLLEDMLPEKTYVLGVDEHTALILDLDAGVAEVRGNGAATLRLHGQEQRFERGATIPFDVLRAGPAGGSRASARGIVSTSRSQPQNGGDPFMEGVSRYRDSFDAALRDARIDDALTELLSLDRHMWDWSRDTLDSDAMDRARSLMRTMIVRLGELAREGARPPETVVGPYVEAMLALRGRARDEHRFDDADALRDALVGLGVEVHDTHGATQWRVTAESAAERATR